MTVVDSQLLKSRGRWSIQIYDGKLRMMMINIQTKHPAVVMMMKVPHPIQFNSMWFNPTKR